MDRFQERLARIGLAAAHQYGFALAGRYTVQQAGLLERPSKDVDLFTAGNRRDEFSTAVTAMVQSYRANGLAVDVERPYDTFAELTVAGDGQASKVELAVDWRANEPILMAVGPVLHPDDAVANKMSALYGRAFARDFIDIDATLRSGRYTREAVLLLAERADSGFEHGIFAEALRRIEFLDADDFAQYGVVGDELDDTRSRFLDWRRELLESSTD